MKLYEEYKIMERLQGVPEIVQVYEAFRNADLLFIIMELCEGGDLN